MATKLAASVLVRLHDRTCRLQLSLLYRLFQHQLMLIVHAQTLAEFEDFAREKGTAWVGTRRLVFFHVEGLEVSICTTCCLLVY